MKHAWSWKSAVSSGQGEVLRLVKSSGDAQSFGTAAVTGSGSGSGSDWARSVCNQGQWVLRVVPMCVHGSAVADKGTCSLIMVHGAWTRHGMGYR